MSRGSPERDRAFIERALRIGIIAAVAVGSVLVLLWLLRAALTPLAVAFVIAYLFDPLIDRFEARGVGRRLAIFLLLGLVGLALLTFAFLVIPRLIVEVASLSASLPGYFARLLDTTLPWLESRLGITLRKPNRRHMGASMPRFCGTFPDSGRTLGSAIKRRPERSSAHRRGPVESRRNPFYRT